MIDAENALGPTVGRELSARLSIWALIVETDGV